MNRADIDRWIRESRGDTGDNAIANSIAAHVLLHEIEIPLWFASVRQGDLFHDAPTLRPRIRLDELRNEYVLEYLPLREGERERFNRAADHMINHQLREEGYAL